MTPAETARVLAKASAFDQRTVGEFDVRAWHEVLADVEYADAMAAVTGHYAEHTDRLMPAHIRRLALAAARERHRTAREEREAAEQAELASRPTTDRSLEIRDMTHAMLPAGRPEALRRPEVLEWERKAARAAWADAEPNPHYDPHVALRTRIEAEENP